LLPLSVSASLPPVRPLWPLARWKRGGWGGKRPLLPQRFRPGCGLRRGLPGCRARRTPGRRPRFVSEGRGPAGLWGVAGPPVASVTSGVEPGTEAVTAGENGIKKPPNFRFTADIV